MYSHRYLEKTDYFKNILVKTNIVRKLERELSSKKWRSEVINIGGVCDSYQKAEKCYEIMPGILKLMIKYKNPVIISTKSSLILRDYDLLKELSEITYVNIAVTITTVDENIRRKIESNSSSTSERFNVLKKFSDTSANIGLHLMPIIPYLTDNTENLEQICCNAAKIKVNYILPGILYLRGQTRNNFFKFLHEEFPSLYKKIQSLYKNGRINKKYKIELYTKMNRLINKYNLSKKLELYKNHKRDEYKTLDKFLNV
jgi:DNA repair photolyase